MITLTRRQARVLRGRLPPLRPRDRPPRPDPAAGLHGRGRPTTGASIGTPRLAVEHADRDSAWPSAARSPCRSTPWPTSRAATTRPSPSRPPRPTGPSPAGPTAASRSPASTPSRRSTPAPFPEPPAVVVRGPGRPARRPGRGDDHGRRRQHPLCPELPPAPGRRTGAIVATDGRQILIQGGFDFPWAGDVLVRRSPLFACQELPRDQPVSIGRTDTHVVLRVGPWTIFLEIQTDVRFPDVDQVFPGPAPRPPGCASTPATPRSWLDALGRLPGADELQRPATLDLNGRIAVRARAADQDAVTELVLARSRYTGTPVRLQTNRDVPGPGDPAGVRRGRDRRRRLARGLPRSGRDVLAWQPLSKDSAIEPADDVIRIESAHRQSRDRLRDPAAHAEDEAHRDPIATLRRPRRCRSSTPARRPRRHAAWSP